MPVDEIASGIFKIIGKLIGQIFIELILELIIKGPGYLIIKSLSKNSESVPSEGLVAMVGILFWTVVALIVFVVIKYVVK